MSSSICNFDKISDVHGNNPGEKKIENLPKSVDETKDEILTDSGSRKHNDNMKRSQNHHNEAIQRYQPKQMRQRNTVLISASETAVETLPKLPEQSHGEVTSGVNPPKDLNSNDKEGSQTVKYNKSGKVLKTEAKRNIVIQSVESVIDSNNECHLNHSNSLQLNKSKQDKGHRSGVIHEIVQGTELQCEPSKEVQSKGQAQKIQYQQHFPKANPPKQQKQRPNSANQRQQHTVVNESVQTQPAQQSGDKGNRRDNKKSDADDKNMKLQQTMRIKQHATAAKSPNSTEGQPQGDHVKKQHNPGQPGKVNREKQVAPSKGNAIVQSEQDGANVPPGRARASTPRNKYNKGVNVEQDRAEKVVVVDESLAKDDGGQLEETKAVHGGDNRKKFVREKIKTPSVEQDPNSTESKHALQSAELSNNSNSSAMGKENSESERAAKHPRNKERSIEHYVPPKLRQQRSQPKEQAQEDVQQDGQTAQSNPSADGSQKPLKGVDNKKYRKINRDSTPSADVPADGKLQNQESKHSRGESNGDVVSGSVQEAGDSKGEEGPQTSSSTMRVTFVCT